MEWWAIFLMVIVLVILVVCIVYFVLKIYFPYHFATINYHINTRGHYASNDPPTLQTFRTRNEEEVIFTETGAFAKPSADVMMSEFATSKDDITNVTDSMILLDNIPSKLGQLQVGLDIDYDTSELIVIVIQGKQLNLPNNLESHQTHDQLQYYVCVDLLHSDDAVSSAKTKIVAYSEIINFKERYLFKVNIPDVPRKIVRFRVVTIDSTDKHTEISKSVCSISDIDMAKAKRLWLNLYEMHEEEDTRGELMISLTYLPTASRITLVIIKAKNLRWKILRQKSGDLLISASLILNGKRICKRQTSVKRKVRDPIFNESLIFSTSNPSENILMKITVSEVLPTGRLYTIGHSLLSPLSSGSELTHWQQMIANPRRPSAMWHYLHKKNYYSSNNQKKKTPRKPGSNQNNSDSDVLAGTDGDVSGRQSENEEMIENGINNKQKLIDF